MSQGVRFVNPPIPLTIPMVEQTLQPARRDHKTTYCLSFITKSGQNLIERRWAIPIDIHQLHQHGPR